MGQVSEVFSNSELLNTLKGTLSIGHNRYGTTGESALKNVQPLFSELNIGGVAIAHNGNLTNTHKLKEKPHCIWINISINFRYRGYTSFTVNSVWEFIRKVNLCIKFN